MGDQKYQYNGHITWNSGLQNSYMFNNAINIYLTCQK
jgi:hypothetical protein